MSSSSSASAAQPIKCAYYPSWDETLGPGGIETKYFTHIIYAFVNPKDGSFVFRSEDEDGTGGLQKFTNTLREKSPHVKTLFAVGGGGDKVATDVLSRMASNSQSRGAFIRSSILVARNCGFDGIDLDWEFPKNQVEMDNLGFLLREWRVEVEKDATTKRLAPLLLTAAVRFKASFSWGQLQHYPATSMKDNLDFINVMTYDYYGHWDEICATGAHTALKGPSPVANVNTESGLESWIQAGVPPSMLVMGLPLYGRTWRLANPGKYDIGAQAVGVGPGKDGMLSYAKVVEFNRNHNARVVHDEATKSVYSVAGDVWIAYDDAWSVGHKINFARTHGLAGYFFWDVCGDHHWTISQTASNSWSQY